MTLQDLLREATRLYLKEQVQLATQLLQLVDQQIAIASESKVSKPIDPTMLTVSAGLIIGENER